MLIKQFEIWIADLDPQIGSEPGKSRPVLVIQSNMLNRVSHPSTIICPITSNIRNDSNILRVHLNKGMGDLKVDCDIMIDQIRAIDNNRFAKKLGNLPSELIETVIENIRSVLDLDY